MRRSLISIIVPVYKCEKYLEQCINSILFQTYSNLEILLIVDGSPDNCPQICDLFAEKDKRVKVFHKSNGGASSARNIGLDNANGDYICFVDGDDILPENSILDLWQGVTNNNCQYAAGICGILSSNKVKNNIEVEKIIDYTKNPNALLDYITQRGSYSPYSKIYDARIIKKYGLRYDEGLKCAEDALFIRQYLSFCSRIVLIPQIVYQYNANNDESLSKKFYPAFCCYYFRKMQVLEKLVDILPLSNDTKNNFMFDRAVHGLYICIHHYLMHSTDKVQILSFISQALEVLKQWIVIDGETVSHKKWWRSHMDFVKKCDVEKIYIASIREFRNEKIKSWLRKFMKKIRIRGINECI